MSTIFAAGALWSVYCEMCMFCALDWRAMHVERLALDYTARYCP